MTLCRLVVVAGVALAATAQSPSPSEQADFFKVSILEKIAQFIEWPGQPDRQLKLCVAADHPLLPALRAFYGDVALADRPLALQVVKRAEPAPTCRLLFLAKREMKDVAIQRVAADRDHILLIAEGRGAAREGVHIAFFTSDTGRLRLEVNRKALDASGLKASFHLLRDAQIVE